MIPSQVMSAGLSAQAVRTLIGETLTGLTAAGTTTTDALVLTATNNFIATCAAGAGVRLKSGEPGQYAMIFNGGVAAVNVYPPTGGTHNGMAANIPAVVQPGDVAMCQYSAATTIRTTFTRRRPNNQRSATVANTSALIAGDMEGADFCVLNASTQATPTFTTRTATQLAANIPNLEIGESYVLRVVNANSGTATMAGGTGVTISGTATLATNTWREFLMTYTALNTFTMVSIGTGATS